MPERKNRNSTVYRAWKGIRKNPFALVSFGFLVLLVLTALLSPFLANQSPLYIQYKGHHLFPAFTQKNKYILEDASGKFETLQVDITPWKSLPSDFVIWPLVTYSPGKSDKETGKYISPRKTHYYLDKDSVKQEAPAKFRHWCGTGKYSDDVLSGIIHGSRISIGVGLGSMFLASLIGLLLGAAAGFWGNQGISMARGKILLYALLFFPALFYSFYIRHYILQDALAEGTLFFIGHFCLSLLIFCGFMLLAEVLGRLISRISIFRKEIPIPLDAIISRVMEVLSSLPKIILIIAIAAIANRSLLNVILIIGFTTWTGIARLVRAEMLKIRELDYIQSARASGIKSVRIVLVHALPNAMGPAMIAIAFGVASAILAESSLSFLNLGVPQEVTTWGSLLSAGRENFQAWWLIVFPGLALFLTVTALNILGDTLRDAFDPRLKQ